MTFFACQRKEMMNQEISVCNVSEGESQGGEVLGEKGALPWFLRYIPLALLEDNFIPL